MDTLGLDEAGRGPVLGPMVMAGIVIPEKKEKISVSIGIAIYNGTEKNYSEIFKKADTL